LHQTGSVERVAAVFAQGGAGEQFIFFKPPDDFRTTRHQCSNGLDWNVVFVVDRQATEHAHGGRRRRVFGHRASSLNEAVMTDDT
jgi:hypothetical protein